MGSVHRLPNRFAARFDQYKVIVSLYYAGKSITDHVSTEVYSTADKKHSETIYFDQWSVSPLVVPRSYAIIRVFNDKV